MLCRDIRGNTRGLHSGEEAIRKPRIPSGRKSGFISALVFIKLAYKSCGPVKQIGTLVI